MYVNHWHLLNCQVTTRWKKCQFNVWSYISYHLSQLKRFNCVRISTKFTSKLHQHFKAQRNCIRKEMRWINVKVVRSYDGQVNNDPTFISLIMFENMSTNDSILKNADSPVILLNYRSYLWSNWDQGSPSLQVHSTGNNFNN